MKTTEVFDRVLNICEPNLSGVIKNTDNDKIDYFILHLTQDISKSLKHWDYINKDFTNKT